MWLIINHQIQTTNYQSYEYGHMMCSVGGGNQASDEKC